jgi:hypothetical protein
MPRGDAVGAPLPVEIQRGNCAVLAALPSLLAALL